MELTKEGSKYIFHCEYNQRNIPKNAKFLWNPDEHIWYTNKGIRAVSLMDWCDDFFENDVDDESSVTLDGNLRPFQIKGVSFCINKRRAFIADEMGLGKTIQAISIINNLESSSVLIVCPASLVLNWVDELKKWLVNDYNINIISKKNPSPVEGINICAYSQLTNLNLLESYDLLIFDESHYLKNHKAKRTIYASKICAERVIMLSGTPLLNRPVELYSILNILFPEIFNDYWGFAYKFCGAHKVNMGSNSWIDVSGSSNIELLTNILDHFMIRRIKNQVLTELPAKIKQTIRFNSNTCKSLLKAERKMFSDLDFNLDNISKKDIEKMMKNVRTPKNLNADDHISTIRRELGIKKVPLVIDFIESFILTGEKVVLFAHHKEVINKLYDHFKDVAVKVDGSTPLDERKKAVDLFQQDNQALLFIGSIQASGVGITLTSANKVVFAEIDWTPAVMYQAEDRCHRIGQDSVVNVYWLVFENSLDELVCKTILSKDKVINKILKEGEKNE